MFHILWDLVPALSIVNERFQGAGSFCCHYVGWKDGFRSTMMSKTEQEARGGREDERGDRVRLRYHTPISMKTDTYSTA